MAQPQSQMPPQAFSPPQPSPSPGPGVQQPAYSLTMPPNKRPRLSPGSPQQPTSPYPPPSSYAVSPGPPSTPNPAAGSPPSYHNIPVANSPQTYTTPYINGTTTPTLNLPSSFPTPTPAVNTPPLMPSGPPTPATPNPQYTNATMTPILAAPPTPGVMGPPSKPADRPVKEPEYGAADVLSGTGINVREEEDILLNSFTSSHLPEARTGFGINAPGGRDSFYGAGAANQQPLPTPADSREDPRWAPALRAEEVWMQAATKLATTRSIELRDPFLVVSNMHRKAEKIAKDYGLQLNLDMKSNAGMGKMKQPVDFPSPKVTVKSQMGPDGALVVTSESFIPHDAYLVDQLALLSIATKHRVRELLEDAHSIATTRQRTAQGAVPAGWADAAAPLPAVDPEAAQGLISTGADQNGVSPGVNPLKRPFDDISTQTGKTDAKPMQITPTANLTTAMREVGKGERDLEEERLRKRQKRLNGEQSTGASRAGSVAPGTPGSSAPEPQEVKAPTKKELKAKSAAAKAAENMSAATANLTSMAFLGFGKKKGKKYDWMTAGASGTSTPSQRNAAAGTPLAASAAKSSEPAALTQEGRNRLGMFKEDGERGKKIQLRDWVVALEQDGFEHKSLQDAYDKLDTSLPR